MPVIIGVVAVVLLAVVLFFVKGITAEPQTPHPDRSRFLKPNTVPPPNTP